MNIKTAIANLDEVITKIEGARLRLSHHHIVKLIGVSKYSSAEDVEKLYEAGQRAYGENKVQDLRDKKLEYFRRSKVSPKWTTVVIPSLSSIGKKVPS